MFSLKVIEVIVSHWTLVNIFLREGERKELKKISRLFYKYMLLTHSYRVVCPLQLSKAFVLRLRIPLLPILFHLSLPRSPTVRWERGYTVLDILTVSLRLYRAERGGIIIVPPQRPREGEVVTGRRVGVLFFSGIWDEPSILVFYRSYFHTKGNVQNTFPFPYLSITRLTEGHQLPARFLTFPRLLRLRWRRTVTSFGSVRRLWVTCSPDLLLLQFNGGVPRGS